MNNRDLKSKRVKILKTVLIILAGTGIIFVFYLVITNFTNSEIGTAIRSEWRKTIISETEIKEEEIEKTIEPSMDFDKDEEEPISQESDPEDPTVDDYFPLKIIIPKIEVELLVSAGYDEQTLKAGPGYITLTPLPGNEGRCTISGHRTIYGAPFKRVDELENGDFIYLETDNDEFFIYMVSGKEIVKPTDVYILDGTNKKELLLTTCHPMYSAVSRLIIIAELIELFSFEMGTS